MTELWEFLDSKLDPCCVQGAPGCSKSSSLWLWAQKKCFTKKVVYFCLHNDIVSLAIFENGNIRYGQKIMNYNSALSHIATCDTDILVVDGIQYDNIENLASMSEDLVKKKKKVVFLCSGRVDLVKVCERVFKMEKYMVVLLS